MLPPATPASPAYLQLPPSTPSHPHLPLKAELRPTRDFPGGGGGVGVEQKWKYSSAQLGPELGNNSLMKAETNWITNVSSYRNLGWLQIKSSIYLLI